MTELPPVAHLHVHLESAVRWATLAEIAERNGIDFPDHLRGGAHRFTSFTDFFDQNHLVRECLRTPDDFHRVAVEFCADQVAQGVGYVEVSFTAAAHGERLGDLGMPLAAVLDGLAEGGDRYGLAWQVILDTSRRRSVERAWRTLDLARKHAGVVAIGLAGDEDHPATPFAAVFAEAREAGLHVVHHAGEAAGPASIREALDVGLTERLGHGIRVLDDPDLVAEVRERGIPLEVCPTSNVALGFAPSLAAHRLPRLRAAGLAVTLNTDIPEMVHTTLDAEYAAAAREFGWTDTDLTELARTSIDASFADPATKARLYAGFTDGGLPSK
ncbi:adenosine deaminase [Asanoa ferruginea]|uniref:Adenosine deaminase n=1 Tax=Asanoa ferruginea TaxID=53367 RepID=A0A3D9ZNR1_9ACTN|nr:adenosine deaminase [Asanoa ferruginea]REF98499.1 adenosine deaminase [Asanoa ferruginea]GIF53800.1 adenosine deaminase [Asanoa ferruginea]